MSENELNEIKEAIAKLREDVAVLRKDVEALKNYKCEWMESELRELRKLIETRMKWQLGLMFSFFITVVAMVVAVIK